MMTTRWEIVRTDAGWHTRLRASNSRIITSSEVYTRRRAAVRAIEIITGWPTHMAAGSLWARMANGKHNWVRDVDERTQPTEGNSTNGSEVVVVDG